MSEPTQGSPYLSKTIPELVEKLNTASHPNGRLHEEIQGALAAKLVEQLCHSIDRHERAASRLSKQLLWLNILLGAFTVIGTILTVIAFRR